MPVEIREISIALTLLDGEGGERRTASGGEAPLPENGEDRQALIDECVETVLRILKDRREP